jgi:hypothetical protein
MTAPRERTYDLAVAVLTQIQAVYAAADVALPDRQYVATGSAVPWDCELLAVSVPRLFGVPLDAALYGVAGEGSDPRCVAWRGAQIDVTILRCDPQPVRGTTAPSVYRLDDIARAVYADAELCTYALVTGDKAGLFGDGHNVALSDWAALGPEGGYVAGRLTARVGLLL